MKLSVNRFREVGERALRGAEGIVVGARERGEFQIERKADGSPVSQADRAAERSISEVLLRAFPDHQLCGEEFGRVNETSESPYLWVYDPIDGTRSYLNYENTVSMVLSLLKEGKEVLSMIYNPFTGEFFSVTSEHEATLNDRALPLVRCEQMKKGVLSYRYSKGYRHQVSSLLERWGKGDVSRVVCPGGSLAYEFAQVAKGTHAAFVLSPQHWTPQLWDFSAGKYLVERAGGQVTDERGRALEGGKKSYVVASLSEQVHDQVLDFINMDS